ncbi:hypothetical protein PR048_004121 [Dryococelus australis]|uniref:Uncharacterized protein n=1 Tax=Dryococelus australis TaxID=614101 RepID=A0ABQ9I6I7_9NEOP|nr:hypothetical protein PR048_004121 [Dryococelus australis]
MEVNEPNGMPPIEILSPLLWSSFGDSWTAPTHPYSPRRVNLNSSISRAHLQCSVVQSHATIELSICRVGGTGTRARDCKSATLPLSYESRASLAYNSYNVISLLGSQGRFVNVFTEYRESIGGAERHSCGRREHRGCATIFPGTIPLRRSSSKDNTALETQAVSDGINEIQTVDRTSNLTTGHMCGSAAITHHFSAETSIRACNSKIHNWLAHSLSTKANRVQSPARGNRAGRCRWGAFSRGSPVSLALSFQCHSILTSITLVVCLDLAVKSRPNLSTHSPFDYPPCHFFKLAVPSTNVVFMRRIFTTNTRQRFKFRKLKDTSNFLPTVHILPHCASLLNRELRSRPLEKVVAESNCKCKQRAAVSSANLGAAAESISPVLVHADEGPYNLSESPCNHSRDPYNHSRNSYNHNGVLITMEVVPIFKVGILITTEWVLITSAGLLVTTVDVLLTTSVILVPTAGVLIILAGVLITTTGVLITKTVVLVTTAGVLVTTVGNLITTAVVLITTTMVLITTAAVLIATAGVLITTVDVLITAAMVLVTTLGVLITTASVIITTAGVLITTVGVLIIAAMVLVTTVGGSYNHTQGLYNHDGVPYKYSFGPCKHACSLYNYSGVPCNHSGGPYVHSGGPYNHSPGPYNHTKGPCNHSRVPYNHNEGPYNHSCGPCNQSGDTNSHDLHGFCSHELPIKRTRTSYQKISDEITLD